MKLDYGSGERELVYSVETLLIYEQEFGGADMIKDLFGRVVVRSKADQGDDVILALDYRDTNWTAALKALWAGEKTADPDTPPFREWSRKVGDVNLYKVTNAVVPEVQARFFRAGDTAAEETE